MALIMVVHGPRSPCRSVLASADCEVLIRLLNNGRLRGRLRCGFVAEGWARWDIRRNVCMRCVIPCHCQYSAQERNVNEIPT
jgi:hypothetical protein